MMPLRTIILLFNRPLQKFIWMSLEKFLKCQVSFNIERICHQYLRRKKLDLIVKSALRILSRNHFHLREKSWWWMQRFILVLELQTEYSTIWVTSFDLFFLFVLPPVFVPLENETETTNNDRFNVVLDICCMYSELRAYTGAHFLRICINFGMKVLGMVRINLAGKILWFASFTE